MFDGKGVGQGGLSHHAVTLQLLCYLVGASLARLEWLFYLGSSLGSTSRVAQLQGMSHRLFLVHKPHLVV